MPFRAKTRRFRGLPTGVAALLLAGALRAGAPRPSEPLRATGTASSPAPAQVRPGRPCGPLLASFEYPAELSRLKARGCSLALSDLHATQGGHSLRVDFDGNSNPGFGFRTGAAMDWRGFGALAFDAYNPGTQALPLRVEVEGGGPAPGPASPTAGAAPRGPRLGSGLAAPGRETTFVLPLDLPDPASLGLGGDLRLPGAQVLQARGRIDPACVAGLRLGLARGGRGRTLYLDNLRLVPLTTTGMVDEFGQYALDDWPGKLKSAAALPRLRLQEEAQVRGFPSLGGLDAYGGWLEGPALAPRAFFGTTQRQGKWWLVTPQGHLFFSLGMDGVDPGTGATQVPGREALFSWLPARRGPFADCWGPRSFNFYAANLRREYGAGWEGDWRSFALKRLKSWGFNTLGPGADPALFGMKSVPYIVRADITGPFATLPAARPGQRPMPDPFDPRFSLAARSTLLALAAPHRDDPWCLGYLVDSDLPWPAWGAQQGRQSYGLALEALSRGASSPAKQAMVEILRRRYQDVDNLDAAWQLGASSWQDVLQNPLAPKGALSQGVRADLALMTRALADRYFEAVSSALRQADPNHLYLGCRFQGQPADPQGPGLQVLQEAAQYCDVVCFDYEGPKLDPREWGFLSDLGRPCLVTGFSFGAQDRGPLSPGAQPADDQLDRAEQYQDYVLSVAEQASLVGCQWYRFLDEPLTGGADWPFNGNTGFVSVADGPYPKMVEAARAVNGKAYEWREQF